MSGKHILWIWSAKFDASLVQMQVIHATVRTCGTISLRQVSVQIMRWGIRHASAIEPIKIIRHVLEKRLL